MIDTTWIKTTYQNLGLLSDEELEKLIVHVGRASHLTKLPAEEILRRIDRDIGAGMAQA